jgi:site-specific recombinase XerD
LAREPLLADLTPDAFRLFILEKQASVKNGDHPRKPASSAPLSSAYIHGFYRAIRAFCSWLHEEGLSKRNLMTGLKLPKLAEPEVQPLTEEEELLLINAYSETQAIACRDKGIFMLMLSTGLRKAERSSASRMPMSTSAKGSSPFGGKERNNALFRSATKRAGCCNAIEPYFGPNLQLRPPTLSS